MASNQEEVADLTADGPESPKLPNMNEFSPGTLEGQTIRGLLKDLAPLQDPDPAAMKAHLAVHIARLKATKDRRQRQTRAGNVLIGMSQCGLLEKSGARVTGLLTDVGKAIVAAASDAEGSDLFAAHIIENCHGRELLDVVHIIRGRGDAVNLANIRSELRSRGFEVTENEGNASKLRQWLEQAKVVDKNWNVNELRLSAVIGASSPTLAKWNGLSRGQRVFLTRLRELTAKSPPPWVSVRTIKKSCQLVHGWGIFPEGRLRADIVAPLETDGWIESKGIGPGRGGDSGSVRALAQLTDLKIELPIDTVSSIPSDLINKLGTPLESIFSDLESSDTHVKGLGLELLALRMVRDLGLHPDGFRERSAKTGGAEVDLIANGLHLHYSRWLVQCKNTNKVNVAAIAKEAGMALVLRAQVIMMVSTGKFAKSVVEFANLLSSTSAMQVVLIDKDVLQAYVSRGAPAIIEWLQKNAYQVLLQKREQLHVPKD